MTLLDLPLLFLLSFVVTSIKSEIPGGEFNGYQCQLPERLKKEIQSFEKAIQKIKNEVGVKKGRTWEDIVDFVDTFGGRPVGSDNLENAIDSIETTMIEELGQVDSQIVKKFPSWRSGIAQAEVLDPVSRNLDVVSLVMSSPTPAQGIEAEMVEYSSDLTPEQLEGKIIHCSKRCRQLAPFVDDGVLAVVMRTSEMFSMYNLHSSNIFFNESGRNVSLPAFGITLEDSEFLTRLLTSGKDVTMRLFSNCSLQDNQTSRNLIGTYAGASKPNETIQIAAHTDTAFLGLGTQDDAVGIFLNINALRIIKSMADPPKRNIQLAMWTAEELGWIGIKSYYDKHPERLVGIKAALEPDNGCVFPIGWGAGDLRENGGNFPCVLFEIGKLIGGQYSDLRQQYSVINSNNNTELKLSTDIHVLGLRGIPVGFLRSNRSYYAFHHTKADTPSTLNSNQLDKCLVFLTGTTYILANLEEAF